MCTLGGWRASLKSHYINSSDRFTDISYSSFAHTSPRRFVHMTLVNGGKTALYSGNKSRLFEAFQLIRPTSIGMSVVEDSVVIYLLFTCYLYVIFLDNNKRDKWYVSFH
jgi:hypothetical protein